MVGGSITLCILSEATKRFTYSFGSALKLVTDLNWDQAIQVNQISPIENTAWWIYSEKIDQPEVLVYTIFKLH